MAYAIWARYPGELWNYPPVIGYKLKVAMPKASPLLWKQAENDAYLAMLGGFVALISKHEDSLTWSVHHDCGFSGPVFEGFSSDLEAAKDEAQTALLKAGEIAVAKAKAVRPGAGAGLDSKEVFDPLRALAEAAIARPRPKPQLSAEELIHELEVHQIELELQNEALREAEAALAESRNNYVDLYEFAPVGYLTLGDSGLINEINLTGAEMLGESRDKLRHRHFVPLVDAEDQDSWQRRFRRIMVHGEKKGACELRLRGSDGRIIDVGVDYLLVVAGTAPVLRVALTDISARRQAEAALRLANDRLDSLVEERTGQWKAACEDAERANEAKSRFLAAASHDLRQPLQALNLYLGVLAGHLSPNDAPVMSQIDICIKSLGSLLGELLDLSKLDAQVVQPNITDFPLADIVDNLVTAYAPAARAKGISLRSVSTRLWAKCDPALFERAVGNLVANAVRYTARGGVLIGCRRRGGKIWFEVVDTGIGIPEKKREVIFEEFRQLGNQERNSINGSGLGLAIVKKTADLLGLDIKMTSRVGRGSSFALSVPDA